MDDQHEHFLDDALLLEVITHSQTRPTPPLRPVLVSGQEKPIPSGRTTTFDRNDTLNTFETVTPAESKPTKKKWTRRRDRNRPYLEIPRLKAQVEELERKLAEQRTKASKRARSALYEHSKNLELKTLVRERHEFIHVLEQILSTQMSEIVRALPSSRILTTRVLPYDFAQDDSIFKVLAQNVDDHYKNMDLVLQLAGLHGEASEVNDAYIWRPCNEDDKGSQGMLLKSRTKTLVPFESRVVEQALWKALRTDEVVLLGPQQAGLPLGTASRIAVLKTEVAMEDYVCSMRMVVKQFAEEDRGVHVWDTLAHWSNVGAARNITTHENGWGYIQSVKDGVANVCECVLMKPAV